MTPIEKELLSKLVFWVKQAEIANKWYGNYDFQLVKTEGLTNGQKERLVANRNQRQAELETAINRITEITGFVKKQYEISTEQP